jgi:hypothetical protein
MIIWIFPIIPIQKGLSIPPIRHNFFVCGKIPYWKINNNYLSLRQKIKLENDPYCKK